MPVGDVHEMNQYNLCSATLIGIGKALCPKDFLWRRFAQERTIFLFIINDYTCFITCSCIHTYAHGTVSCACTVCTACVLTKTPAISLRMTGTFWLSLSAGEHRLRFMRLLLLLRKIRVKQVWEFMLISCNTQFKSVNVVRYANMVTILII